jgi:nifR3 family TIM-barrel protein
MRINLKHQLQKNPILLAPMAGVTDIGFRELCEEMGASYTCSELIPIEALIRGKISKYWYEKRNLKINCVQIFGSIPESFEKAVDALKDEADIIDINFGCPAYSVTRSNYGSSLLKDPKNVGEIVSAVVKKSSVPVTAKIRLGYKSRNYLEIAREIEAAGADALTIHARTAEQKHSGSADWNSIKELHDKLKIPVIGNGDIRSEEDVDRYLNSHADGLMIGRAAMGNPMIFERFKHYIPTGKKLEFDEKEMQKKLFAEYIKKLEGTELRDKLARIKFQAMWFMGRIDGAKDLRIKILSSRDTHEIIDLVERF